MSWLIYYLREIIDYFKKNKNVQNRNGLNLKHYRNGKGALESKFYLKNGKKDGVYLSYYYSNGQLKEESNWKDGQEDGFCLKYYENGQLEEETNWKDGSEVGIGKGYYESGQLRFESEYLEEGSTTTYYYESGEIKSIDKFGKGGNDHISEKSYYKNGQLQLEHKNMYRRKDGIKKNGFMKWYYESGELKSVSIFFGGEEIGLTKCYDKDGKLEKEVPYMEMLGSGSSLRFNERQSKPFYFNPPNKNERPTINITQQTVKNGSEEYKHHINQFINEMKKISDWYEIIQARGNGHAMFAKSMNIKVDDYEYWANAHKEEYLQKYNDGNLDIEGINLRIEKFGFIVAELEKVIKKAAELNINITNEMHNDYCAARASLLGAEYALKEMSK